MIFAPEKSLFSSNRSFELTGSFQGSEISLSDCVEGCHPSPPCQKKSTYAGAVGDSTNISAADRLNEAWSGSEEVIFFLAAVVSQSSQFVALSSAIVPTSPFPQINVQRWLPGALQPRTCETFRAGIQSGVVVSAAAAPGTRSCFPPGPKTILRG